MEAVVVKGLSKFYDQKIAVDDISFAVNKGEIFGLIGPDGAGKTSIFRILTTLLLADKGVASVDGYDVVTSYKQIRNRVGYMPGRFSLYPDLTIEENLHFFAAVFNTTVEANYHLIKDIYVQIAPFKDRRAGKLSGGMKQKLALCCALIHKPSILFLDEPTTGVDPVSRKEFWEMLKQLKQQDITIVVSTPYMDEANLCDRIALLQNGRVLSVDTPSNIINAYPEQLYAVKANNMHLLLKALAQSDKVINSSAFGEFAHISLANASTDLNEIHARLALAGLKDIELHKATVTIEDCFIKLLKS